MQNIVTCLFAVALCLTNALVWTFFSGQPVVGVLWVAAAALCLKMQQWSRQ